MTTIYEWSTKALMMNVRMNQYGISYEAAESADNAPSAFVSTSLLRQQSMLKKAARLLRNTLRNQLPVLLLPSSRPQLVFVFRLLPSLHWNVKWKPQRSLPWRTLSTCVTLHKSHRSDYVPTCLIRRGLHRAIEPFLYILLYVENMC